MTNKMGTMEPKKLVLSMSAPIAAAMLISALYNFVDSAYVANYSDQALIALSLCAPIQMLMIALACGTAAGFNTVLSQALGSQNMAKARQTYLCGLLLSWINGLIFALFGWFGSRAFLSLFTDIPAILDQGEAYLKICCLFSFCIFVEITYERITQAHGDAIGNLVMQGSGALINIILDPFLIFGWFGLPSLGVTGAALATIIGQFVGMLVGIGIVHYRKIEFTKTHWKDFRFSWSLIREIYRIGIPAILMQAITSFMTLILNGLLGLFSLTAISAFNIISRLQQLVYMVVQGLTNALIPMCAFNYGARANERILQIVSFSLKLSIGIMLCGCLLFEAIPEALFGLFNADEQMLAIGVPALRIISLSFVFAGISMVLCSVFQALNHPMPSLIITLLRQPVLLVPLLWILAICFGLQASWWSFVISEVFCAILSWRLWKKIEVSAGLHSAK